MAEKHVLDDRELRHQREFLIHRADSVLERVRWTPEGDFLTIDIDLATVWEIGPTENLEKGGFAGPVVANECRDLTGRDAKVYPIECVGIAEIPLYSANRQRRRASARAETSVRWRVNISLSGHF
jgi:hypothetical protein